jgi:hypothetical protein
MRRLLCAAAVALLLSLVQAGAQSLSLEAAAGGTLSKIATVTANSGAASIPFANLAGYNNLELQCNNIVVSGDAWLLLQVGEGAAPTWETASAGYTWSSQLVFLSNGDQLGETQTDNTLAGIGLAFNPTTGGPATSLDVAIFGAQSTTANKGVAFSGFGWVDGTSTSASSAGGGSYTGDFNALTAVRLIPASGTISSGTCSLYGLS